MKFTLAVTIVAVVLGCVYSRGHHHGKKMNFPNCPHSEFFNNTIEECKTQTFGEQPASPEPRIDGSQIDPTKKEAMRLCVSEKLGFDCEGTITADDVNDFMATVDVANETIRTALVTDVTNCITEHQGVGPKVMRCSMESLKKNCS